MPQNQSPDSRFVIAQAAFIYAAFVVTLVVLFTDRNLQTDFGSVTKGYFLHWYGLLITALLDVAGASILIVRRNRKLSMIGAIGTGLLAVFLVLDIFTYSMVGFSTYSQFASYLFGISKYPGSLSYIPGLYDVLLAVYIACFAVGIIAARAASKN